MIPVADSSSQVSAYPEKRRKHALISIFYGCIFAASLICTAIYIFMWHKHFDVNFTLVFTLVPLGYVISEIVFLLIAYRVNLYDVSNTVIDSYVQEQKVGYISFDF